jgi:hypothetical protein
MIRSLEPIAQQNIESWRDKNQLRPKIHLHLSRLSLNQIICCFAHIVNSSIPNFPCFIYSNSFMASSGALRDSARRVEPKEPEGSGSEQHPRRGGPTALLVAHRCAALCVRSLRALECASQDGVDSRSGRASAVTVSGLGRPAALLLSDRGRRLLQIE